MRRYAAWLGCAFVVLALLAGCTRGRGENTPGLVVDATIEPMPASVGMATVTVTVKDVDGQPVTGAQVEVRGDMSHAGMVPVSGQGVEREAGTYAVPLEFTMAGDWILTVRVTLADGRVAEHEVKVVGVGGE